MSERQVQYTDGSWSREVEVTDDAVEAATRLLSGDMLYTEENIDRTLRALVERAQHAEFQSSFRETEWAGAEKAREHAERERDEARGKLDKVRELVTNPPFVKDVPGGYPPGHVGPIRRYRQADMQRDVLAILDGKDNQ
jgi:hypothetical protein